MQMFKITITDQHSSQYSGNFIAKTKDEAETKCLQVYAHELNVPVSELRVESIVEMTEKFITFDEVRGQTNYSITRQLS